MQLASQQESSSETTGGSVLLFTTFAPAVIGECAGPETANYAMHFSQQALSHGITPLIMVDNQALANALKVSRRPSDVISAYISVRSP